MNIKKIAVGPNDILVINVEGHLPCRAIEAVRVALAERLRGLVPPNRIAVLSGGVTLTVLSSEA